jgi:hypothetical protein
MLIDYCCCMREVLCCESILVMWIFNWVRREGRKREGERDMQAKYTNRTVCFHIIYQ